MGQNIKINAMDGSGTFSAFIAAPETGGIAPAVIVIQEIFGVNEVMRGICKNLAQAGYIAVCPDLFWRQEPGVQLTDQSEAEWAKAFKLYQGFDVLKGVEDLKATLAFMRRSSDCSGKVGTLGYCLGGKMAFLMGTRSTSDCNVSYYGVGIDDLTGEVMNINKPMMMHLAEKDKFVQPAAREKILNAVRGNRFVQAYTYFDVDHAFARVRGQHYDKKAATLANYRTAEFLATHLLAPPTGS